MAYQWMGMTVLLLLSIVATPGLAREDAAALAKVAQNPLADRVSLPLENTVNQDVAGSKEAQNVLDAKLIYRRAPETPL